MVDLVIRLAGRLFADYRDEAIALRVARSFSDHDFTKREWDGYKDEHPGTHIHPHIVDNRGSGADIPASVQPHPPVIQTPAEAEGLAYMSALKSGDMESAGVMVGRAAKKAGYTIEAFHGSPEKNITTINRTQTAHGFFLTPDKATADYYTGGDGEGRTYHVYLKADNVLDLTDDIERSKFFGEHLGSGNSEWVVMDRNSGSFRKPEKVDIMNGLDRAIADVGGGSLCREFGIDGGGCPDDEIGEVIRDEADEDELMDYLGGNGYFGDHARKSDPDIEEIESDYASQNFYMNHQDEVMRAAQNAGYHMVVFDDPSSTGESVSYVVFDPSRIKSAEPVEYDDHGRVVPIGSRFNDDGDDMRGAVE